MLQVITIKDIQESKNLVLFDIVHNFNNALSSSSFPTILKYADASSAFKKKDESDKKVIDLLSLVSKLCERLVNDKIHPFFGENFPTLQCGFRRDADECLIRNG